MDEFIYGDEVHEDPVFVDYRFATVAPKETG